MVFVVFTVEGNEGEAHSKMDQFQAKVDITNVLERFIVIRLIQPRQVYHHMIYMISPMKI